ncbi:arylsulfatase G [Platysternon megacephalum]|uniref:Arylsulfatase G n=1 Tax=Platysternon megacephalum TaxID=55544 RepID=A0A4D9E1V6_9SAUR|nr:arylsulfatase G [Platysternon megacephalum]
MNLVILTKHFVHSFTSSFNCLFLETQKDPIQPPPPTPAPAPQIWLPSWRNMIMIVEIYVHSHTCTQTLVYAVLLRFSWKSGVFGRVLNGNLGLNCVCTISTLVNINILNYLRL